MQDPNTQFEPTQAAALGDLSQGSKISAQLRFMHPVPINVGNGIINKNFIDIPIDMTEVTIGRRDNCTVSFNTDTRVSGVHLILSRNPNTGEWFLKDTSSNGTIVNRKRVERNVVTRLRHGDEVALVVHPELSIEHNNIGQYCIPMWFTFIDMLKSVEDIMESFVHEDYCYVGNQTLGGGNFSHVRVLMERATGIQYACKIVDKSKFFEFQRRQCSEVQWDNEYLLLKDLNHENIVQLNAVFDNSDRLYLIMEYCRGGDLLQYCIDNGPIEEPHCAMLFKQLLLAVDFIHSKNIAHRDIKPENILLTSNRKNDPSIKIKLSDFGLSKFSSSSLKTFCGTASYIAPEVSIYRKNKTVEQQQQQQYSHAVDLWALGVVLYIMISATPPFGSDEHLFSQIENGQYFFDGPLWETKSNEVKDLIRAFLHIDPAKRCTAREALQSPWIVRWCDSGAAVQQPHVMDHPMCR